MKKYLLLLLTLLGLFVLSGCGGGGSDNIPNDPNPPVTADSAVAVTLNEMVIDTDQKSFNVKVTFTKKVDSSYKITVNQFSLKSENCKLSAVPVFDPTVVDLNAGVNSKAFINISGTFDQNCSDTSYVFSWVQKAERNGKADTRMFSKTYDADKPDGGGDTPAPSSGFFNATTPLEITQADTEYQIKVQLLEEGYIAEGKIVKLKPFDRMYGDSSNYEAVTGADGYAVFEYTSPQTLPADGTETTLELTHDNNGTIITQLITLKFVNTGLPPVPPVDTTGMTLTATPDPVQIANAGDTKSIVIQLAKGTDPVTDTVIKAHILNLNEGTLDTLKVTTNSNGQAVFNYTAPQELPSSNIVITFEVDNGSPALSRDVTVQFDNAIYNILPDSNITVTNINSTYTINVGLTKQESDGTIQPAVGKTVVAEFIMPVYGKLASYEVKADSSGIATFQYTSPDRSLPTTDFNITFFYKDDKTVTGKTLVNFEPQAIDTVQNMYLAPESFTITAPNEVQTIKVVTVNSQNVGVSAEVKFEEPNNGTDYGSFDKGTIITDSSGQGTITYTAPADISNLVERNITVNVTGTTITKELNLKFNVAGTITKYEIVATTPNSFAIESNDSFGIKIVEIGNPSNVISDANVHEVNLTSLFDNMLVFDNGSNIKNYTGTDALGEYSAIGIESKTLSGTVVIKVSALIDDDNDASTPDVTITQDIPVVIISGPVSVMSIPYVGSGTCTTRPELPADKYLVHAVDKYANPAQGVQVTPTLINGIRGGLLPGNTGTGTLSGTTNPTFSDSAIGAANVQLSDRLIITITNDRKDPSYLGGWTIDQVAGNDLHLKEEYTPPTPAVPLDNLAYAVGSEDRILGRERVVAHIENPDGNYLTDGSGILNLEVCYDPKLVLHNVVLAAYVVDRGHRTGISSVQALRWDQFVSSTGIVDNNGTTQHVFVSLQTDGTIKEPLIGFDINPSAFEVEPPEHCKINTALSDFHTSANGQVDIAIVTDGNTSVTGGADKCTVTWNAKLSSISPEY